MQERGLSRTKKSEAINSLNQWINDQDCEWMKATLYIKHLPLTYNINLKKVINNTFNMSNQYIFGKEFKKKDHRRRLRNISTQAGSAGNGMQKHFHCLIEKVDFMSVFEIQTIFQKSLDTYATRELKKARFKYYPSVWMENFEGSQNQYINYITRNENDNFGIGIDKVDWDISYLRES